MTPPRNRLAPAASGRCFVPVWALALTLAIAAPSAAFELADVASRAQALAGEAYQPPEESVPGWLREISYDQWRDIRFRPEAALWRDAKLAFQVQFFHPGLFYDRTVDIHEVVAGKPRPVAFSPSHFDYGTNDFASRVPQDLAFAGFRVHYPLKRTAYLDELVVFLGASYFRALGRDSVYGLSARGLAIDTAEPAGEEFPWFREFWLVRPAPGQQSLVVFALLDSPSLTGAYRFAVTPGVATSVDVEAALFARQDVGKLGLAPLTSMFFFGELTPHRQDDFRPEVHDSDGLALETAGGERIWRPLDNRRELQVSSFDASGLKRFGLLQRDRDFDHYQDLEVSHELRPSVWIEPRAGFEAGRVELVEIPTVDETHDNVVAAFVPSTRLHQGESLRFAYRMLWESRSEPGNGTGRVVATRRDRGRFEDGVRVIVDFAGGALAGLPPEEVLEGVVTLHDSDGNRVESLEQRVERVSQIGGYRLVIQLRPDGSPIEMRAFLKRGESALTETWTYLLVP